ncbi:protein kinase domain-containing protein [Sphaerisporangium sp. NPDC004334]
MPPSRPLGPTDPPTIASYRVTGRIGEGGQGIVYAAETESGARVAVKLLHRRFSDEEQVRRSFGVELRRAQRVTGPRVARVLAYGLHDGRLYYASEYVDGTSLWEVVERQGPRSTEELSQIALGTLTALTAIHQAGAAHGDFGPSSVLLGPQGPQVIDFAIGRVLERPLAAGGFAGASPFSAPEHLAATIPGPESDMFAWAGMIVYAATGRAPFGQDSVPAVVNRILNGVPDLSALSGTLLDAVTACLDRNPARRPAARELLARLEGVDLGPSPRVTPAPQGPAWTPGAPPPAPGPGAPPAYGGPIPLSPRPAIPAAGRSAQAGPPGPPPQAGLPGGPPSSPAFPAASQAGGALPSPGGDRLSPDPAATGPIPPLGPGRPVAGQSAGQSAGHPGFPTGADRAGAAAGPAWHLGSPGESGTPPNPGDRRPLARERLRGRRDRVIAAVAGVVALAAIVAIVSTASGGGPKTQSPGAAPPPPAPATSATSAIPGETSSPPVTDDPTPIPSPARTTPKPSDKPEPTPRTPPTRAARPLLRVSPARIRVASDYISYVNIKLRAPRGAVTWRASISEGGVLSTTRGRIRAGSSATITAYGTPYCSTSKVRFTSNGGSRTVTIIWGGILC